MRNCKFCGARVENDTVLCPACGKAIPFEAGSPEEESTSGVMPIAIDEQPVKAAEPDDEISICLSCQRVFRGTNDTEVCPKCAGKIQHMGIPFAVWNQYSLQEKQSLFRRKTSLQGDMSSNTSFRTDYSGNNQTESRTPSQSGLNPVGVFFAVVGGILLGIYLAWKDGLL